jgi:hypothetical protein
MTLIQLAATILSRVGDREAEMREDKVWGRRVYTPAEVNVERLNACVAVFEEEFSITRNQWAEIITMGSKTQTRWD